MRGPSDGRILPCNEGVSLAQQTIGATSPENPAKRLGSTGLMSNSSLLETFWKFFLASESCGPMFTSVSMEKYESGGPTSGGHLSSEGNVCRTEEMLETT